jgi:hypothetical protein
VPRHQLDQARDAQLFVDFPMQALGQEAALARIADVALNDHHGDFLVIGAEQEERRCVHRTQSRLPLGDARPRRSHTYAQAAVEIGERRRRHVRQRPYHEVSAASPL